MRNWGVLFLFFSSFDDFLDLLGFLLWMGGFVLFLTLVLDEFF